MAKFVTEITGKEFEEKVEKGTGVFLVDFWAPWCGPCLMIAPILEQIAQEYEAKLKVLKLNVDADPGVAEKYGIAGIPTMVLFRDVKPLGKSVGASPKQKIKEFLDTHLQ